MTKTMTFLICALMLGCGDPHGADFDDYGSADGGDKLEAPAPQTEVYAFDCDTLVGGIEDLPIAITVAPGDAFVAGFSTPITLSGSITLDQDTVAGIASRGVDIVDITDSGVVVRVSGATPVEIDLPGPTITGFDLLEDTDGDGLAGPHTFEAGPITTEVVAAATFAVGFTTDINSLRLSISGVPIVGSITIPDFCNDRALDGDPITFPIENGDGAGGSGGSDDSGAGGAGGADGGDDDDGGHDGTGDDASECDRERIFDDGRLFNGRFRQRLCELLRRRR